ncbi:hypothetical protein FQ192_16490 [Pseudomonas sp. ANT_J12]|uniref:hypothetical protein n=1 Tax=Pseudomonas sp. ANT_J12 TaxID=2597351 RepID=UPI0011F3AA30|nr:hypothetical protein [Pseudomonas sp. ANT_J12]KAA0988637.1 hypothetical protein FQ192_16490 [Pseudomonas sp. ANT_J12]
MLVGWVAGWRGMRSQRAFALTAFYSCPVISGSGNSVNYQSGFPDLQTIQAQRPNISNEQYAAIKPGMTYQQVLDIVKIPGRETANSGSVVIYTWGNELYVYMMFTMVDGKLQSKGR